MRLHDFALDPATGVLVSPDAGVPAGYLDGAEQRLLDVLRGARDRSVGSPELRAHARDWPSHYHLTPYRSTILDCFGFTAGDARVLELGAGCGAITRWLGERCGEVAAVEGNLHRAAVARARCADLDNVAIHCANYSELDEVASFDVATLIGVLEYGHLYHPRFAGDPLRSAADNLAIARRALRDDGVLVLAIENRLGLKYLNGAREDHSGRPYESVQGYPHATAAVTFSAEQLRRLLRDAGFAESAFFLPYPDYKLAATVVNADHAGPDSAAHNWLPGFAPDRGSARETVAFSEPLAERELVRAGLLGELANSFLVLAFAGARTAAVARHGLQTDWRSRHYALDRQPGLRKRVTIDTGDAVHHEPADVSRAAPDASAYGVLRHRFAQERRVEGELLVFDAHEAMAAPDPAGPLTALVRAHRDWLLRRFATGWVDHAGVAMLDGAAFDATWWNIVRTPDGRWEFIDREWTFAEPLTVDFVLWRTLHHFAQRFAPTFPTPWRTLDARAFADRWMTAVEPDLDPSRLGALAALDRIAATSATGDDGAPPAPPSAARVCVAADIDALIAAPELLRAYTSAFAPDDPVTLLLHVSGPHAPVHVDELRDALGATGVTDDALPPITVRVSADPDAGHRAAAFAAVVLDDTVDATLLRERVCERWVGSRPAPAPVG